MMVVAVDKLIGLDVAGKRLSMGLVMADTRMWMCFEIARGLSSRMVERRERPCEMSRYTVTNL